MACMKEAPQKVRPSSKERQLSYIPATKQAAWAHASALGPTQQLKRAGSSGHLSAGVLQAAVPLPMYMVAAPGDEAGGSPACALRAGIKPSGSNALDCVSPGLRSSPRPVMRTSSAPPDRLPFASKECVQVQVQVQVQETLRADKPTPRALSSAPDRPSDLPYDPKAARVNLQYAPNAGCPASRAPSPGLRSPNRRPAQPAKDRSPSNRRSDAPRAGGCPLSPAARPPVGNWLESPIRRSKATQGSAIAVDKAHEATGHAHVAGDVSKGWTSARVSHSPSPRWRSSSASPANPAAGVGAERRASSACAPAFGARGSSASPAAKLAGSPARQFRDIRFSPRNISKVEQARQVFENHVRQALPGKEPERRQSDAPVQEQVPLRNARFTPKNNFRDARKGEEGHQMVENQVEQALQRKSSERRRLDEIGNQRVPSRDSRGTPRNLFRDVPKLEQGRQAVEEQMKQVLQRKDSESGLLKVQAGEQAPHIADEEKVLRAPVANQEASGQHAIRFTPMCSEGEQKEKQLAEKPSPGKPSEETPAADKAQQGGKEQSMEKIARNTGNLAWLLMKLDSQATKKLLHACDAAHPKGLNSEDPEVSIHEVKKLCQIGSGSFGAVWKAQCRGEEVAIKQCQVTKDSEMKMIKEEIQYLYNMRHPRLVSFLGYAREKSRVTIIMEFMPGGSLSHLLFTKKMALHFDRKVVMASQIVEGLSYLHQQNVVHRDLKTLNVILDSGLNCKICDFGLTVTLERTHMTVYGLQGSPRYMAPEQLDGGENKPTRITEKVDIWQMGCVMLELFCLTVPYSSFSSVAAIIAELVVKKRGPAIPDKADPRARVLISSCLRIKPKTRPRADILSEALRGMCPVEESR
eukprot:TRINITY_DN26647_c0_g1_i1.p1 TRINITY_DN26647_c0_g1~~TRINITY_DN26647_c0_g1_i1.p1  ORF type:complete len:945 (-),score=154.17 TRINITY_DN26647_c0_g1_i1:62-2653(-)